MVGSPLDSSISLLLECQVFISNLPFIRIESMALVTSLASSAVDRDPATSST